jgi:HSP20 family protein
MMLVHDLDRLTCRVFGSTRSSGARLDAYRIDDTFHVDIDLPGVDPADIDIGLDGKVLTVRAQRGHAESDRSQRQLVLADSLDTDRLDARYDNGVLTLSIPLKEQAAQAA